MNSRTRNPFYQHTLARKVDFVGVGLHTGQSVRMTLLPAAADTGYVFERLDVAKGKRLVPARWDTVSDTRLSTTVSNLAGVSVGTIEHLMSALAAAAVDNCHILLDGPEVPVMDGSARAFLDQIDAVGLQQQDQERRVLVITKPVWAWGENKSAAWFPFPQPWFDLTIDFASPVIGRQNFSMPLNDAFYRAEIARARTFGFSNQVEEMKAQGLARGGSLQNAILVGDDGVVNKDGLRFSDEFVRHKLLDAVGDLALAGTPIMGRFVGSCTGHELNNKLLRNLLQDSRNWRLVTMREATEQWHTMVHDGTYEELLDLAADTAITA